MASLEERWPESSESPRRIWRFWPLLLGAVGLGAGAAYVLGGSGQSSKKVYAQLRSALQQQNRAVLREVLSAPFAEQLSRADLDHLLANLPNYNDSRLKFEFRKPQGLLERAQNNTVTFSYDGKLPPYFNDLRLHLSKGQWKVNTADLFYAAAERRLNDLKALSAEVVASNTMDRNYLMGLGNRVENAAQDVVFWATQAQDADEGINASATIKTARTLTDGIQARKQVIAEVSALEDVFSQARNLMSVGNISGAIDIYHSILKNTSATPQQLERARTLVNQSYRSYIANLFQQAQSIYEAGKEDEAQQLYEKIAQYSMSNGSERQRAQDLIEQIRQEKVEGLFAQAVRLTDAGELEKAREIYETLLQSDLSTGDERTRAREGIAGLKDAEVNTLIQQASATENGGDINQALSEYREILTSATLSEERRQFAEEKIAELETTLVRHKLSEGDKLYDKGDYPGAISLLKEVVESEYAPDDVKARAYYVLSYAFRDDSSAGGLQQAIEMARKSTELEDSNAEYWCSLGDHLRNYKSFDLAANAFLTGIDHASDDKEKANCYVWKGANELQQGNHSLACDSWKYARLLDPNNANAERLMTEHNASLWNFFSKC